MEKFKIITKKNTSNIKLLVDITSVLNLFVMYIIKKYVKVIV